MISSGASAILVSLRVLFAEVDGFFLLSEITTVIDNAPLFAHFAQFCYERQRTPYDSNKFTFICDVMRLNPYGAGGATMTPLRCQAAMKLSRARPAPITK
jgi:hypothetical protein